MDTLPRMNFLSLIMALMIILKNVDCTDPNPKINSTDRSGFTAARRPKLSFLQFVTPLAVADNCKSTSGLEGTCLSAQDCLKRGGRGLETCAWGLGVCCVHTSSCGGESSSNSTYFVSPNYPNAWTSNTGVCTFAIKPRIFSKICQLRLDFEEFYITGPTAGICSTDMFVASGQDLNHIVPALCGQNSGQHRLSFISGNIEDGSLEGNSFTGGIPKRSSFEFKVEPRTPRKDLFPGGGYFFDAVTVSLSQYNVLKVYLQVASSSGPYRFTVTTSGESLERKWKIRVTQIPCGSKAMAPPQCLQYFTGSVGSFQSFNYGNVKLLENTYFQNMDYTICLRKEAAMCGATFTSEGFNVNVAGIAAGGCTGDFLSFGTDRKCGGPATVQTGIRLANSGPMIISFVTDGRTTVDSQNSDSGFSFKYSQFSCSSRN